MQVEVEVVVIMVIQQVEQEVLAVVEQVVLAWAQ
jgi:hypothetical protein